LYENTRYGSFPKRSTYAYIRERVAYTFYDPTVATDALVDEVFRITTDAARCLSIVRMAKSAQRHYVADLLPEIPTPTLLIWGDDDTVTPPRVAREFESLLPHTQLVMLARCGHAPMMERPEAFNAALQRYLENANSPGNV
jgi:pimeloyl-ACP methyl ester carboxylesterase